MLVWNSLLRYQKVAYLKCIKCFGYFNFLIYLLNLDLWFWIGQGGRVRWISTHDSGSCHPVLPSSRDPDGQPPLQQCYWHLVCRLYLCRVTWAKNLVSGTESHPAGISTFPFNVVLLHRFMKSVTLLPFEPPTCFCVAWFAPRRNPKLLWNQKWWLQAVLKAVVIHISFWNV